MPKPKRKSIRLKDFDYSSAGAYFVTICVYKKKSVLGCIEDGAMKHNILGLKADEFWNQIPQHHEDIELDEYVVMPNHIHGIIFNFKDPATANSSRDVRKNVRISEKSSVVLSDDPAGYFSNISPVTGSLGRIIGSFKSAFTGWCNLNGYKNFKWQGRFHDRIIRTEDELNYIREYIHYNPLKWEWDRENPANKNKGKS